MSPEQLRRKRAPSDIWRRLASSSPPSFRKTIKQCTNVIKEAPIRLVRFALTSPPVSRAIVLRCLEKDASQRYDDVVRLMRASLLRPDAKRVDAAPTSTNQLVAPWLREIARRRRSSGRAPCPRWGSSARTLLIGDRRGGGQCLARGPHAGTPPEPPAPETRPLQRTPPCKPAIVPPPEPATAPSQRQRRSARRRAGSFLGVRPLATSACDRTCTAAAADHDPDARSPTSRGLK
jgi:hypothetical protein